MEGVIPRSVKDIFAHIMEKQDTEFLVKVSFMELYNEQLFDLLSGKPRQKTQWSTFVKTATKASRSLD